MRFSDKTVMITGATSGMGLAGARRLAREGARLILHGSSVDRSTTLRAEFPDAVVLHGDLADPCSVDALASEATLGIDGLWLNAGFTDLMGIGSTTAQSFDRMMAVNVRAPFLLLGSIEKSLRSGGSVVVTASTSAYEGAAGTSVYAATKGAIVSAVRSWATELAPRNIRVNTIVPGAIDTDLRRFIDRERRTDFETAVIAATPLGRVGAPEEAAAVALFLLSDDASYVTGSQYHVDGGLLRY